MSNLDPASKPGHRTGRRPGNLRTDKGDMMDLCAALHARGLGCRSIALLTGYSDEIVAYYMRCAGLPRQNPRTIRDAIINHLPAELAAQCHRLLTRSRVAHERALNRINETQARAVHILLDAPLGKCVNSGGAVRPKKAA